MVFTPRTSRTWFEDEGLHAQGKTWPGIHALAMKVFYKNQIYDLNIWQGVHRKNGTRYIDIIYTSKENILSALYYPNVKGKYESHFYFYTPKIGSKPLQKVLKHTWDIIWNVGFNYDNIVPRNRVKILEIITRADSSKEEL